jgi:hypothetical protein
VLFRSDDNYLYLFVKVTDATYVPDGPEKTGETNIDNIELFFFPNANARQLVDVAAEDLRSQGLTQLRASVGNTVNRATGGGLAMSFATSNVITGYEYKTVQTATGYNIEIVVPWDVVIPDTFVGNLAEGGKIMFDITPANCTTYASGRNIILGWSSDDFNGWKYNYKFGEMIFGGTYSGIISPQNPNIQQSFHKGELQLFNVAANTAVTVYDLSGRKAASANYTGQSIYLSDLASGVYVVNIGGVGNFKIVK